MSTKILVTGANGTVGSEVAAALKRAGITTRLAVRDTARAASRFGADADVVAFDLYNPATWPAALQGINRMFLIAATFDFKAPEAIAAFIAEAKKAGVTHVVYSSAIGADGEKKTEHSAIEAAIKDSGMAYTFLRPNFFSQNFINFDKAAIDGGTLYMPTGDGKVSYVDARDIADSAVGVLRNPEAHIGKAYMLTGGEALSIAEIAAVFSDVTKHEVKHVDVTGDAYKATLLSYQMPEAAADRMTFLYDTVVRNQWAAAVTPAVQELAGRAPIPFKQFVADYFTN